MEEKKSRYNWILVISIMIILVEQALAQQPCSIRGKIVNPYEAAGIALSSSFEEMRNEAAEITLFSEEEKKIVTTVKVLSTGEYIINNLPPGRYSIEISVRGNNFHYTGIPSGQRREMPVEGKKYGDIIFNKMEVLCTMLKTRGILSSLIMIGFIGFSLLSYAQDEVENLLNNGGFENDVADPWKG